jgi:CheY-like chemotaxis protein
MQDKHDLRHVVSDAPRVMVVDGSKLVRKLVGDTLLKELPNAQVIGCSTIEEAKQTLEVGTVDLVTTALVLPDGDGLSLARCVREAAGQAYVPVIVISGSAQEALETRAFTEDITDYFDKSLGHDALAAFIRGYVHPAPIEGARILYVEDSRVVALATQRMLERNGLQVLHMLTAEEALEHFHMFLGRKDGDVGADLVLSDVYLKGALSGRELLNQIRGVFRYGKRRLPMVMMTGDENRTNQANLLREGANDLILKPIEERLLVTKILFQLRLSKLK